MISIKDNIYAIKVQSNHRINLKRKFSCNFSPFANTRNKETKASYAASTGI